jgi:hypothetical protein
MNNKAKMIARLNDQFRKTIGQGGRVYMTQGIQALPPEDQLQVLNLVKTFNDFSEGNDPYGEHDFGAFDFKGDRVLWKIDYYDNHMEYGSEDPADPEKTVRVMTVMMGYEY